MKVRKALLTLVLVAGVVAGAAYAGGRLWREHDHRTVASSSDLPGDLGSSTPASPTSSPAAPTNGPSTAPTTPPTGQPSPGHAATAVLRPGATGIAVRNLQQRLFQLSWLPETSAGRTTQRPSAP